MLKKDKYAFAVLSGVLFFLSFPPYNNAYLAFFAFVPILTAIDELTAKESFILGCVMGFVFGLGLLYWIYIFNLLALPGLLLAFSLFFGISFFLYKYISDRLFFISVFLFPIVFTSIEYLRSSGYWGFPWGLVGYSQYNFNLLIQISEITGVFGVSFLVLLANTSITFLILSKFTFNRILIEVVSALIIFFIVFLYGYDAQKKMTKLKDFVNIALVQPNFNSWENWYATKEKRKNTLYYLTLQAVYEKPQIIVWPESAIPEYFIKYDKQLKQYYIFNPEWKNYFETIFKKYNGYLLINVNFFEDEETYYNSAFLIDSNLHIIGRYDKIHLVPFGETLPFIKNIFLMKWLANWLGTSDYSAGSDYTVFQINNYTFACIICFEDAFGDLSRKFVKNGAQFLINLTNDGWAESQSVSLQHNAIAVFRAIENRTSLFRCTNTGVTSIIDPQGNISKIYPLQKSGILLDSSIINKNIKTFYTRYGDLFANFILIGTLVLTIIAVFKPQ